MTDRNTAGISMVLLLASPTSLLAQHPTKKLIEFGWDRPSPAFVAANIATMEQQPFAGVVIQLSAGSRVFRLQAVDTLALNRDAALLQGTRFQKFTDNFVLVNLTPDSTWDWFDDKAWGVSESNLWRTARSAKQGKVHGIALDYESYGRNPWDYRKLPHGPGRTFDNYAAQVRARGRRVMIALQSGFPGLDILTFFQFSYLDRIAAIGNPVSRRAALAQTDEGLLAAFVAGMLEVANDSTSITDGNERAYWYADSNAFRAGARAVKEGALTLIPPELQQAYRQRVSVGQTVFVDYLLGLYQRAGDSVATRVAPGDRMRRLEYNVYQALRNSDEYVWVYSQKVNWWKPDSLPPGLADAVERALRAANGNAPLGFGAQDFIR